MGVDADNAHRCWSRTRPPSRGAMKATLAAATPRRLTAWATPRETKRRSNVERRQTRGALPTRLNQYKAPPVNTNSPLVVSPAGCSMIFSSARNTFRRRGVSDLCCDRAFSRLRGREFIDELRQTRLVSCRFVAVDQVLGRRLIELLDRDQQGRLGVIDRLLSRGDSSGGCSHLLDCRSQRGPLLLVADATTFVFSEGTSSATSVRHKVVNQKTVQ